MAGQCSYCGLLDRLEANDSGDLRGRVTALLNHVVAHLGVHAADVLVYDATAQKLLYAGGRGFHTNHFENLVLPVANTTPGKIVEERRSIRVGQLARAANEFVRAPDLLNEGYKSYVGAPLIQNDQVKGVLEVFHRESLNPGSEWMNAFERMAEVAAISIGSVMLVRRVQRQYVEVASAYDATIESWSNALEMRDFEPKGHTARVTEMACEFARLLKLSQMEQEQIRRGAWLHDVGKMGIPDNILLKTDSLTEDEWIIMRRHPLIAYEHLHKVEFLRPSLAIPYCHHEMWDGSGYPQGLKGEQIPLQARIFALVDVWDSLRSDRPYRKAWPEDKVKQYVADRGSKHFDQDLADKFLKLMEEVKRRRDAGGQDSVRTYQTTQINV